MEEKLRAQRENREELRKEKEAQLRKERLEQKEKEREEMQKRRAAEREIARHKREAEHLRRRLEDHYGKMKNFIRTRAEPTIFYLPAKHNKKTEELLEDTRSAIAQKVTSLQAQVFVEKKDVEYGNRRGKGGGRDRPSWGKGSGRGSKGGYYGGRARSRSRGRR